MVQVDEECGLIHSLQQGRQPEGKLYRQSIEGRDSGKLEQQVDELTKGDIALKYKELPRTQCICPGKEQGTEIQQRPVAPQEDQKAVVVLSRTAPGQIVHQKSGEQAVPIGEGEAGGDEGQDAVQVLIAEQRNSKGDGEQDDRRPPPGQPPEEARQQDELGQRDDEVEGTCQVAPDDIARQISQGKGKITVADKVEVVNYDRQQVGEKNRLQAQKPIFTNGGGGVDFCSVNFSPLKKKKPETATKASR